MRLFLIFALCYVIAGCRSPQAAYHVKIRCAPSYTGQRIPQNVGDTSTVSIEELVQLGLVSNPRIKEARHRVQSLKHRIPQELSLPDPVVNTSTHLAPVETAAGRQAFAVGISQQLVNLDRRATKAAIANDEVCAAQADLSRLQQELAEQIRTACFQLLAVQDTIRITREDLESLRQIEEVVLRQFEMKRAVSQQDVLSVQIEQSKVENQLNELLQKEKSFSARVARLAHFEPGTLFILSDSLSHFAKSNDVDSLIAEAMVTRPELAGPTGPGAQGASENLFGQAAEPTRLHVGTELDWHLDQRNQSGGQRRRCSAVGNRIQSACLQESNSSGQLRGQRICAGVHGET